MLGIYGHCVEQIAYLKHSLVGFRGSLKVT